jgi:hypothetical protein
LTDAAAGTDKENEVALPLDVLITSPSLPTANRKVDPANKPVTPIAPAGLVTLDQVVAFVDENNPPLVGVDAINMLPTPAGAQKTVRIAAAAPLVLTVQVLKSLEDIT